MSSHLIEIDGKYPWGVSPLGFGAITLTWKILVLIWWLFSSLFGPWELNAKPINSRYSRSWTSIV